VKVKIQLEATTAHEARREIAHRWPEQDVRYWGYRENGECAIGGLVRRKGMSSGRLGGKPKKPGSHTPIHFLAEVEQ
jgi:hypothetical protein